MKQKLFKKLSSLFLVFFLFVSSFSLAQTPASSLFDNGKMWTFDYPPMKYFKETYNFTPTEEWFEKARLAAVRLPNCSASFISEDGLVMTNHHCSRSALDLVNRPGENLGENGFYAATLDEERKVPNMTVDQLQLIKDVSKEVQDAFDTGKDDAEKVKNRDAKISEIEKTESEKTGLRCNIIRFYNGGRYSLYGYKRYTDIRIVFAVETQIGFYGGDPDNFTYPRYDVDLGIFRVYDETGKPLKPKYYFKWSKNGAQEGDAVFVIGNPGRTSRLLTVSQLEYNRDFSYKYNLMNLEKQMKTLSDFIAKNPDKKSQYQTQLFGISNSWKAFTGIRSGLIDPVMMARKKDFENKFKTAVMNNPNLKSKYGNIWDEIEKLQKEKASIFPAMNAVNAQGLYPSQILMYARQMKTDPDKRNERFKADNLEETKKSIINNFDANLESNLLSFRFGLIAEAFGEKDEKVIKYLKGLSPEKAAETMIKNSVVNSKENLKTLLEGNPDDILNSTDPYLSFVIEIPKTTMELGPKMNKIRSEESAKVQLLGKAIYEVYGTQMPPDATFTLRIADGVVKGYDYNGTIAPPVTTFYGMYDRHYSFKKEDWDLPTKWKNPPANFDMKTPVNFVATCDIIGGNSGSPVINKNHEVVGLVFDGNIESLPGEFIFMEEKNRTVSVHSAGILEALDKIYKAERIVKEIKVGKILK